MQADLSVVNLRNDVASNILSMIEDPKRLIDCVVVVTMVGSWDDVDLKISMCIISREKI